MEMEAPRGDPVPGEAICVLAPVHCSWRMLDKIDVSSLQTSQQAFYLWSDPIRAEAGRASHGISSVPRFTDTGLGREAQSGSFFQQARGSTSSACS